MYKESLQKVGENVYEIPPVEGMHVPGRVFLSPLLLENVEEDALAQVAQVARLPGIQGYSFGMSDMHSGYGFSIGGVAGFDLDTGVVSPGGVGFDINCGVRLLRTNLTREDLNGKEKELMDALFRKVPAGVGERGIALTSDDLNEVLRTGSQWAVSRGYGTVEDCAFTEERGTMDGADPRAVSVVAKQRGLRQLGSLGGGNHFLEVQVVDEVFDVKSATVLGLEKGHIVVLIHSGSRGLGHQVATDYVQLCRKHHGNEFGNNLESAPITSALGKKYVGAMAAAANFAFANRQVLTQYVRTVFQGIFPSVNVALVYDITHNIARIEEHTIGEVKKELLVLRKGATRSFGPGWKGLPESYTNVGQPIFIPGSMGTASYVMVGTARAEEVSMSSTPHGAGRVESRTQARARLSVGEVHKELSQKGVIIMAKSQKGIVEEAPSVYKDVEEVVRVSESVGIGKKVARLRPIGVVKG